MRAVWIVTLGLAGGVLLTGAATAKNIDAGNISKKEIDAGCASVKGKSYTTPEGGYGCVQLVDGHPYDLFCTSNGRCTLFYNTVKPNNLRGFVGLSGTKVMSGPGPAKRTNIGITAGAAQGSISVSPLKQVGSNTKQVGSTAATASTTMAVSPAKQAGPSGAAGASPNPGVSVLPGGRATLRQP